MIAAIVVCIIAFLIWCYIAIDIFGTRGISAFAASIIAASTCAIGYFGYQIEREIRLEQNAGKISNWFIESESGENFIQWSIHIEEELYSKLEDRKAKFDKCENIKCKQKIAVYAFSEAHKKIKQGLEINEHEMFRNMLFTADILYKCGENCDYVGHENLFVSHTYDKINSWKLPLYCSKSFGGFENGNINGEKKNELQRLEAILLSYHMRSNKYPNVPLDTSPSDIQTSNGDVMLNLRPRKGTCELYNDHLEQLSATG